MAKFFRSILFVAAVMLFAACANSSGGDEGVIPNLNSVPKQKLTLSYDKNQPESRGTVSYQVDKAVPVSVEKEEGSVVTAASFDGKLVKYDNSTEACKYSFVQWNTKADGSGSVYKVGDSVSLNENLVLYAIYSSTPDAVAEPEKNKPEALDFSVTKSYKMKVGETVPVVSEMNGVDIYYAVQGSSNVVEVSSAGIKAVSVGTQIVDVFAWDENNTKLGSCVFEVTAEGFDGNEVEYKLTGKWNYDDGVSYLKFNSDKTGQMLVYLNGNKVQECTFKWSAFKATNGTMYLQITDGADYINKSYEVSFRTTTSLHLKGYLAVFTPQETNWTKE